MSEDAVPYHEPTITTILTQTFFILTVNLIDYILNKAIYCGLIGQILVGTAWGTPGADILGPAFQQAIIELGYLGLILIVFEGGLSTNMKALRSNIVLSLFVALTGIMLPIGLSFLLVKMCGASLLQAFAAGCALSSTSLGTTFTILKSSGLGNSRLGVVLTSAAMLDDVVGLVLVQVIRNLGSSAGGGFSAVTIIRPVFVSLGYAAVVPILLYLFRVLTPKAWMGPIASSKMNAVLAPRQGKFIIYTILLVGAVTSAAYAGTSVLFAAYLAGLLISSGEDHRSGWQKTSKDTNPVPAQVERDEVKTFSGLSAPKDTNDSWEMVITNQDAIEHGDTISKSATSSPSSDMTQKHSDNKEDGLSTNVSTQTPADDSKPEINVYDMYYGNIVAKLLKGFFFASIGLSIPISRLFDPPTLWRGLIYSLLMIIGKLSCGIWLVRFSRQTPSSQPPVSGPSASSKSTTLNLQTNFLTTLSQYKPQSPYPASILGTAMVARGEIGFLISAIAQANGVFDTNPDSESEAANADQNRQGDLFLIVTWAILVCTVVGPVSVGLLTRRVKRLRMGGSGNESGRDPLGVWSDL